MSTTLASVQWFRICDLADMWEGELKNVSRGVIEDELRLGWHKWTSEKNGVEGFRCGVPLTVRPPDEALPPVEQHVDREFLTAFSIKQRWPIPDHWKSEKDKPLRDPGRPSIRFDVLDELKRRAENGEMAPSLAGEAKALRNWVEGQYEERYWPTVKTIENQIRSNYHELKVTP